MSQRIPEDLQKKGLRRRANADVDKLTAHRGMATWGETLVPLGDFRQAVRKSGKELTSAERLVAVKDYLEASSDDTLIEGPFSKIIVFGGVYSNSFALHALLDEAQSRRPDAVYCLGDLGGFGPNPETIWPLLTESAVRSIQGNYEESLAGGRDDCNCGYADPRDNHFAEISYSYTARNCSSEFKRWMGGLPKRRRVRVGQRELLFIHGSPRRINEFLFFSSTSVPFLETLLDQERCDGILCTHTGLHWHRRLPSGRDVINVGVIGRPANDGRTEVWYSVLNDEGDRLSVEFLPLAYDYQSLASAMRREGLPDVFVETITSGWWTTCLEILPARERAASRF